MKAVSWFVRRRPVLLPTVWGWLVLLAGFAGAGRMSLPGLHRFLAIHQPIGSGILAVEGWIPDDALSEVISRFNSGRYERIYAVGGPIPMGARLTAHGTLADLTVDRLIAEGLPADRLVSVPADDVDRDRTLASARSLRRRLEADGVSAAGLDIVTVGTHARRTWRIFRCELKPWGAVGVIQVSPTSYDTSAWWRTSQGFRSVVYEVLAYAYTLVFGTCQPAS